MISDKDRRALILKTLYEHRYDSAGFVELPNRDTSDWSPHQILVICNHLRQHGLIEWHPVMSGGGSARITADGVDIVEGNGQTPPIAITTAYFNSTHVQTATGNNARVTNHSTDNSTNTVTGDIFGTLTNALEANVHDAELLARMSAAIDDMRASQGRPEFATAYQRFISLCSDHMGVVAPFIEPLSRMFLAA